MYINWVDAHTHTHIYIAAGSLDPLSINFLNLSIDMKLQLLPLPFKQKIIRQKDKLIGHQIYTLTIYIYIHD